MLIAGANTAWIIRNSPAWIQEACFLLSQDVGWTLCCISCFNFLVKIQVESQILIGTYHLMKALIWKDTGGREGNLGKVNAKFWRNFVTIGRTFLLKLEIETKFSLNEVIFISWGKCPWGIFHTSQYWFSSISILFFFGCFAFLLLKIDFFSHTMHSDYHLLPLYSSQLLPTSSSLQIHISIPPQNEQSSKRSQPNTTR